MKPVIHKPYGLLMPHKLPTGAWKSPWTSLSNFQSQENLSGVEYDSIWVVVCKLTKYVCLIPYIEESMAINFAYAFRRHILECIPDRDKLWISHLWTSLMA